MAYREATKMCILSLVDESKEANLKGLGSDIGAKKIFNVISDCRICST